jgi:hypothetical protein
MLLNNVYDARSLASRRSHSLVHATSRRLVNAEVPETSSAQTLTQLTAQQQDLQATVHRLRSEKGAIERCASICCGGTTPILSACVESL